ncbi:isoniazid inducible gene protein IniC [Actinoplanes sp. OR16]|uniref:dynamin family protein n=1 Tax=Actinoplanes sp. OR16 TaxID=946334 RepID=UPI000F6FDBDA|nr:dynamin family protein [Actinoplanes sp. OR16]BBH69571.1 isoniazid inducible gene protein IniC [Actinoplanes sp. OR16]
MVTQRPRWPLTESVIQVAERAVASRDAGLSAAGSATLRRLRRPLGVAVVGRVSAGKSTLVNAVLGTAVSPTAGNECTRVVYVFAYGGWTGAMAHPRDPALPARPLPFTGSRLSDALPYPAAAIERVDVTLTVPILERATVFDTPGLESTNRENSAVTERMLGDTMDAAVAADALLFCVNGPIKEDEETAVRTFRTGRSKVRMAGGSAVAVLTKADEMGEDRRLTLKAAESLAERMSRTHADIFGGVFPVVGLLAEAATTGALRARHAAALAELAAAWTVDDAGTALQKDVLFYEMPGPVDTARRRELMAMLGRFGVGELLEVLRTSPRADAGALTAAAREASGYDQMERRLRMTLGSRADVMKAGAALHELMDCALVAGDDDVYAAAQQLLDRPEMFPLQLLDVSRQLASGRVTPPPGLAEHAWIAVTVGLSPVRAKEAAAHVAQWRHWASLTDTAGRSVARVMIRAWQLAADAGRRSWR